MTKVIDKTTTEVTTATVCFYMDWSYPTLMRWLKRYRNGEVVCNKRGYEKMTYDPAFIQGRIDKLDHKNKRTKGTENLFKEEIAPRRILRHMIKDTRKELNKKKHNECYHVNWKKAGTVWAIDDTLIRYDKDGQKRHLTNIQDLASHYKFNYTTRNNPSGMVIAELLEKLFKKHGAPLFLKRDNGSNLCSKEVNEVLVKYMVIPVNSPVRSPKYNGAIERSQSLIKSELSDRYRYDTDSEILELHIENICHELNHKIRKSLKGKHSCECFSERKQYSKRKRKELYDKVVFYTKEILKELNEEKGSKSKNRTAIRQAAKQVMLEESIINITLERTGEGDVLPY